MVWRWRSTPRLYWRREAFLTAACCCCGVSATAELLLLPLLSATLSSLDVGVGVGAVSMLLPVAGDVEAVMVEEPVSCESGVEELECDIKGDVVSVTVWPGASEPPDSDLLLVELDSTALISFGDKFSSPARLESGAVEFEGVTVGALTVLVSLGPPSIA